MLFFSLQLGWLPVSGRLDLLYELKTVTGLTLIDAWLSDSPYRHEMIVSAIRHMVLPIAALAVAPTTEVVRLMRIQTDECSDTKLRESSGDAGIITLARLFAVMCCITLAADHSQTRPAILHHADAGDDH